jgi:hypothetical protein
MTKVHLMGLTVGCLLLLLVAPGMDCQTGGMPVVDGLNPGAGNMGDTNDDGHDSGPGAVSDNPLGLVLTPIRVHVMARIEAGDDIIVYTAANADGQQAEVNYVIPSQADIVGRSIPDGDEYDQNSFKVAGDKIVLCGGPEGSNALSIFDPMTNAMENIPASEVTLSSIPVSNYGPGFIDVDGSFIATINLIGSAGADGTELIRVIDVSGATAQMTKFAVNPDNDNTLVPDQIHVDAETRTVVASRQIPGKFWVYDLDDPAAAPMEFDVTSVNGPRTKDTPFAYDNGMMLFIGRDASFEYPFLIDLLDPNASPVAINPPEDGVSRPMLVGDRYAYLPNGAAITGSFDSSALMASNASIDGGGRSGSGVTLTHGVLDTTPVWIIGGQDNIGTSNALQYSTGNGDWTAVLDPRDPTNPLGVGDVHCDQSGAFLGFKYESDDDSFLGYAILN